jgi:hypothetical protein
MKKSEKTPNSGKRTHPERRFTWHSAFFDAIRLELEAWQDALEFQAEHPLTREPLRIDVLIIKKKRELVIDKNIAAIFRRENILEFKSPDDSLSVADFHKVLAYAHLYYATLGNPGIGIQDITVSFVSARHPREVLKHLRNVYGYTVVEKGPGLYYIRGDILPIQLIETKKLDEDENLWLKDLSNDLDAEQIGKLALKSRARAKTALMRAYLDVVLGVNAEAARRVGEMKRVSMEQLVEEMGLAAQWEARGEIRGKIQGKSEKAMEVMKKALAKGMPVEDIADLTGLDSGTILGFKN